MTWPPCVWRSPKVAEFTAVEDVQHALVKRARQCLCCDLVHLVPVVVAFDPEDGAGRDARQFRQICDSETMGLTDVLQSMQINHFPR